MYHVGGNIFLNIKQMAPWIVREEMGAIYWEWTKIQFSKVYNACKGCHVALGFVSCVLRVRNRCILTVLRKLTYSEGSPRPQRFL